jgi:hypothetical protein
MQKGSSFFDSILKIVAFLTVIIVIAGFLDQKFYYNRFGISINNYINASEILLSSIDKLALVLFSILIQLGIWLYLFKYLFEYDMHESLSDGEPRPRKYHDETIYRFLKSKTLKICAAILFGGTLIVLVFYSLNPASRFWQFLRDFFFINTWIGMTLFMGWIQGTRSLWEHFITKGYDAKAAITFIVFSSTLVLALYINNASLFVRIMKHGNPNNIEITLMNDKRVFQTDTIRYIGRTENYVFYWNRFTRQATIYPQGEIKQIDIR